MNTPATTDAGLAHGTYRTQLLVNQKSIRVLKNLKKLRVEAHPNGSIPRRPEGEKTHAMRADEPLHFGIGNPHREEHGTDPATLGIESLEVLRVEAA